jgi:rare lipoprotein A
VELGMVRTGTARVEVRALGSPPASAVANTRAGVATAPAASGAPSAAAASAAPGASAAVVASAPPGAEPAAAGAPPPAAGQTPQLYVQVGAFSDEANARRLVEHLQASGFPNSWVVSDGNGRRALHRVRIGPLRDAYEFDQVSGRLRTVGVLDSRLVAVR